LVEESVFGGAVAEREGFGLLGAVHVDVAAQGGSGAGLGREFIVLHLEGEQHLRQ